MKQINIFGEIDIMEEKENKNKFESSLLELHDHIDTYQTNDNLNGDNIMYLLRKISSITYYLESERGLFYKKWNARMFELTKKGMSVAKAKIQVDNEVPELNLLRLTTKSSNNVMDAMRTHLSGLKSEFLKK